MEAGITSGPDRKLARSPTSCLCTGAKPNGQVGHFQTQRGCFAPDLKVADRTKETLEKAHVERANGSQQGELGHSTLLLVRQNQRSITDATWMVSEVQGSDPFVPFRAAWASSPGMRSTREGSSGMISFHLTGNPEYGSGRHRVEKLGQTTRWMLAASISVSG